MSRNCPTKFNRFFKSILKVKVDVGDMNMHAKFFEPMIQKWKRNWQPENQDYMVGQEYLHSGFIKYSNL